MKKLFYSLFALAMTAMTLTSCEDVPAPYDYPTDGGGDNPGTEVVASGTGTADDPFNVAGANKYIKDGGSATAEVYVKGKIVSVKEISTSFGNATYYISDDGTVTNQFTVYRGYAFGNVKFQSETEIKAGDEVIVCGKLVDYSGTYEFTQGNYIYSLNGKTSGGGTTGEATGDGTSASPYNVAAANKLLSTLGDNVKSDDIYIKGKIVSVKIDTNYGNATYYISDDGASSNQLEVYRGYYFDGAKFTSTDQLKAGDEIVIVGKVVNYVGTSGDKTPEVTIGSKIVSINGKTSDDGGSTGGGTGSTGSEMTSALIVSGNTGSVTLATKNYGSQSTSDEATWYTWAFNNITYKGAKVCVAEDANGGGIQMQGNASDAAKQGFLFNSTAFGSDIKTITIILKVVSTSTYSPSYSLYAGTDAHPTSNAITASSTNTDDGTFKTYTEVFDLSGGSYKYFTISNDKAGALYIDKVVITLK